MFWSRRMHRAVNLIDTDKPKTAKIYSLKELVYLTNIIVTYMSHLVGSDVYLMQIQWHYYGVNHTHTQNNLDR
jgi:hypothetical protein